MKYSGELKKVENLLQEAIEILQTLHDHAEGTKNYPMAGSLYDFKNDIAQVLECDSGEGGLAPFIKILKKEGA